MDVTQKAQETFIRTLIQGQTAQPKDVKVTVGNQTFDCHKHVLSIWSDYFRAAFESGMKEQATNTVALPDDIVSVPAFQQLYDYMYSAKLDVQQETVYPMITASHYLRMPSVLVLCTSFLQENAATISQDLALQLATLQADDLAELRANSMNKLAENFSTYLASDKMLKGMTLDTLEAVLQSERLRVQNEAELFAAVLKWLSADPDRSPHGDKLLKHVRLGLVPGLELLQAMDKVYLTHMTEHGPILREILGSKLDKSKEETTRSLYPQHYTCRPLVNITDDKEVLVSMAPDRKMLMFTQMSGWQFTGESLPKTRSNFLSVGDYVYMVTPRGMLSRLNPDTKKWEKVSKVPFVDLYEDDVRLVHLHPAVYVFQGRYNAYFNHQSGRWGQICPLPTSTTVQYWKGQPIVAADVMHDGRFVITWAGTLINNVEEYVSSAVYDRNTNAWTQLGQFQSSHDHYIITDEKFTFLLKKNLTHVIDTDAKTGYYFNGSWVAFNLTYHANNIGAVVNPMTGKDVVVAFGGVATPSGIQRNPQGYYPCLEENLLKLNPENGLQVTKVTKEEGGGTITSELLTEHASVIYISRKLC